jgi:mRNA interferase MazF
MMSMPSYSKHDVILVTYPFTDLSNAKIRPAIVASASHPSSDLFIVPLTSRTGSLLVGEFVLSDWSGAGLNVASAVKRGIFTVQQKLVLKSIGKLQATDIALLERSLRLWLGIT